MPSGEPPVPNDLTRDQTAAIRRLMADLPDEPAAFAALGRTLGAAAMGDDPEARGRSAWSRRGEELSTMICRSPAVRALVMTDDAKDATDVAIAIAGALVSARLMGIDVVLCACVASRIGLRRLCGARWNS